MGAWHRHPVATACIAREDVKLSDESLAVCEMGEAQEIGPNAASRIVQFSTNIDTELSAEIGAVAPVSDTLRMPGSSGMAPSSRDRISVDLQGLKAALHERARASGTTPSALIRESLIAVLGRSDPAGIVPHWQRAGPRDGRVRLSLRMSRADADALVQSARKACLSPGAFVVGLVGGIPALSAGASRPDHLAALFASSAELSTLSRNLHHLTSLLREGNVKPALMYHEMLDTLAGDIRSHLEFASCVLADLQPQRRSTEASRHPTT